MSCGDDVFENSMQFDVLSLLKTMNAMADKKVTHVRLPCNLPSLPRCATNAVMSGAPLQATTSNGHKKC